MRICKFCSKPLSVYNKGLVEICHACQISSVPRTIWVCITKDGEVHLALHEHAKDGFDDIEQIITAEMSTNAVAELCKATAIFHKHADNEGSDGMSLELLIFDIIPTVIARALLMKMN
jgi:hypothetical protein